MDVIKTILVESSLFNGYIISYICEYFCDQKFFYHDTIESYVFRKHPSFIRKLYYHLNTLVLLTICLKYFLLIINPSIILKVQLGEIIFILTCQYKNIYICIVVGCLLCVIFKLLLYYQESNFRLNAMKLIFNLQGDWPFYRLNKPNQDRFILVANILFWLSRFVFVSFTTMFFIILVILHVGVYFFSDFDFNILILIISVMHAILCYQQILILFTGGFVYIFIIIIFLNMKLREIIKLIRISVLWRNKLRLLDNMMNYHKFSKLVNEISGLINMLIGIMYMITPIFISPTIIILKNYPKTLVELFFHLAIIFWYPVMFLQLYIINHYCASIPLRNRSIAKLMYPVFYDKNFHRIETQRLIYYSYGNRLSNILIHMKIDSLVARLNKQFVGFYCFNLFKFTKLALLQYFCYFFTVYVLIWKLNNLY